MITTTVRFDQDTWGKLALHALRLNVAKAAIIRDATMLHLTTIEVRDSTLREQFGEALISLDNRLGHVEQCITRGDR